MTGADLDVVPFEQRFAERAAVLSANLVSDAFWRGHGFTPPATNSLA